MRWRRATSWRAIRSEDDPDRLDKAIRLLGKDWLCGGMRAMDRAKGAVPMDQAAADIAIKPASAKSATVPPR
jgi:hypothetical protein